MCCSRRDDMKGVAHHPSVRNGLDRKLNTAKFDVDVVHQCSTTMYYLAGTLFTFLSAAYHLWLDISSEGTELHSSTGYTGCHGGLFVQDSDVKLCKSAVETSKWRIVRSGPMTCISGEADAHSWTVMAEAHHQFASTFWDQFRPSQCVLNIEFLYVLIFVANRIIYLHSLLYYWYLCTGLAEIHWASSCSHCTENQNANITAVRLQLKTWSVKSDTK
jgi:hypothetical protein